MNKETLLKQFYKNQIAAMIERCNDQELLDLIYRLLETQEKEQQQGGK